jgi:GAF domain-containing protein
LPDAELAVVKIVHLHMEQLMEQNNSTRAPQGSVSAALSAVRAEASARTAGLRFPGEDAGRSLAEMAQRDLDAALQLLADRAQYITGASGAAIALRRSGKNDMLCRASAGENAPELGALLSTEFGLSGESVRTRQPLRCDDAERDARVNRDVCRQMGIASVVVMPVVNDDEVLGVFELFSGKANAFGERDLSALQRLSEMVETAVKLARAAESIPQQDRKSVV